MQGPNAPVPAYLLSLPERALRSLSALAGGLLNQLGEAALPSALRRTRLYRNLVEAVLRFLIEQVGEVEGVFPSEGKLADNFLLRRTAGNGIELVGILTFHASPVWVLAALADLSGAGRVLITEISTALKQEGLIAQDTDPGSVDQILDALEMTAGRAAAALNAPPLDVAGLRREWASLREEARGMAPSHLPRFERLEKQWRDIAAIASKEQRSIFQISAMLALETLTKVPRGVWWIGRSSRSAARVTRGVVAENILEHYSDTLEAIRTMGLAHWWRLQFRPYLLGAARQFSPGKTTWTQRMLGKR